LDTHFLFILDKSKNFLCLLLFVWVKKINLILDVERAIKNLLEEVKRF